jgi:hypothetical protein
MENKYYVYALFDLNESKQITLDEINQSILFKPYYIGKGCGTRILSHRNIKNTKLKKDAKTKSLLNRGYNFEDFSLILKNNLSETEAYNIEKILIEKIGLDNLTNITPGGLGGSALIEVKTILKYMVLKGQKKLF